MGAWHEGPLCGLDFETTSVDVETARIVTACAAMDLPGEEPHIVTWLADPGCEIPPQAAEIHGITTERARAEGQPSWEVTREIIITLAGAFGGMPLVIYNAPYDTTVLDRAARRSYSDLYDRRDGWEPTRLVIDPLVLDKQLDRYRRGSRKLADVCRHYGITLDNAHDATADTLAAIRLARELGRRYPQIGKMTAEELHDYQVRAKAEQAESFQKHLRSKGSSEVISPAWPMIPWTETVAPSLNDAQGRLILCALRCAADPYRPDSADAAASAEYEAEQMALAARDLVRAIDSGPADRQPVGWAS